jgi:hypothetical protein
MMLWRWDHDVECWQPLHLPTGEPLPLSRDALFLPLRQHLRCALLSRGGVAKVNGLPTLLLCVLSDRDAIEVNGETVYFTLDSVPEVVVFAAQGQEVFCGRCKAKLHEGEQVIQCPRCKAWHHQSSALSCWTYAARCSGCEQPTSEFSWTPEPLTPRRKRVASAIRQDAPQRG